MSVTIRAFSPRWSSWTASAAEGEADHPVHRVGLAGAHQIGELLDDDAAAEPLGDRPAEPLADADLGPLARRLRQLGLAVLPRP